MSDVNAWLADYYGNDKTASAEGGEELEMWNLFKAAAAEDGIDADALDDEEIDALAEYYVQSEEGEEGELPPNWDEDDVEHYVNLDDYEKTAFVQFKEAEFLGQVMAHSMESERSKIAGKGGGVWGTLKGIARGSEFKTGRGIASEGRKGMRSAEKSIGQSRKTLEGGTDRFGGKSISSDAVKALRKERSGKLISQGKKNLSASRGERNRGYKHMAVGGAKTVGLYGGAAGAVGLGARKALRKEAGAIEALAEARAVAFLKQAGYEEDDGYDIDDAVDQRAAEMLIENGYGELLQ